MMKKIILIAFILVACIPAVFADNWFGSVSLFGSEAADGTPVEVYNFSIGQEKLDTATYVSNGLPPFAGNPYYASLNPTFNGLVFFKVDGFVADQSPQQTGVYNGFSCGFSLCTNTSHWFNISVTDADDDGYAKAFPEYTGADKDCDDSNPNVNPGKNEICNNGIDDDCDGLVDNNDPFCSNPFDQDGDGFCQPDGIGNQSYNCSSESDCDDTDGSVFPGAVEKDNGIDDDCDDNVDEGFIQGTIDEPANSTYSVNDDENNTQTNFTGIVNVTIYVDGKPVLVFPWDSDNTELDLDDIVIDINGTDGSIIINGVEQFMPAGGKKIAYMDYNGYYNSVCVHDAEIVDISNITTGCNGDDETIVKCDGTDFDGYVCEKIENDTRLMITGLKNSAIKQQCQDVDNDGYGKYCPKGPDCADGNPKINPGKTDKCGNGIDEDCSGSDKACPSSGGGGGGSIITCDANWTCSDWSACSPDGTQTRECVDQEDCGDEDGKPEEEQSCTYKQPGEPSSGTTSITSSDGDENAGQTTERGNGDVTTRSDDTGTGGDEDDNAITGQVIRDNEGGNNFGWLSLLALLVIVILGVLGYRYAMVPRTAEQHLSKAATLHSKANSHYMNGNSAKAEKLYEKSQYHRDQAQELRKAE